jgi:hypothetical protein
MSFLQKLKESFRSPKVIPIDNTLIDDDGREADSKVRFRLPDGPHATESVWATSLGNNLYRIENYPFYVYDVSWKDVVLAVPDAPGNHPVFQRIVRKSGSCTIRVFIEDLQGPPEDHIILKGLNALGCWFENADSSLFAIALPPNVDFEIVCRFLNDNEATWEHGDPSYETLYPNT